MRPCGGRFAGLGVVRQDPVDRRELGEWRVQLAGGDLFAVDFDVLEERLVEEASFGRVGLEVGGLDVVGELEREVESAGDGLLVDLVAVEEVLGGGAFTTDAGLFLREDVLADLVGVMRRQELALLVVKPGHLRLRACGLFGGDLGDAVDVGCDGVADPVALQIVELDRCVVALDSLLGYFYLTVLPGWLGLDTQGFEVSIWVVARTVLIFLGIPLVAGYMTRQLGIRRRGREWFEQRFLPRIAPVTLYGLLFTILLLFAVSFTIGRASGLAYDRTTALAFTASSNNFELAIAVAVGVLGATSGEALAGVVGPLIEVPVLVALVYVAIWLRRRLRWPAAAPEAVAGAQPGS